jgi:moderate conductance mechanosensitive channel
VRVIRSVLLALGLLGAGTLGVVLAGPCVWTAMAEEAASPAPQRPVAAPADLPPGFTQQQFDALVDAISRSVATRLRQEQEQAAKAAKTPPAAPPATAEVADDANAASGVAQFLERAAADLYAAPGLFETYARVPAALDRRAEGGPGLWLYLVMLAFAVAAALAAERATDALLGGLRQRAVTSAHPGRAAGSVPSLIGLALIDAAGLGALFVVTYGFTGLWFSGTDPQARLAFGVLSSVFNWRLYMYAFRVVLRPSTPEARLAPMPDADAAAVYRSISAVVVVILVVRLALRIAIAMQAPREAVGFGLVVANVGLLYAFLWACFGSRQPVAQWFTDIAGESALGRLLARNWLFLAVPFFCAMAAAQIFGAVMARFAIPAAMLLTLNTVLGLIILKTLIEAVVRRVAHGGAAPKPGEVTLLDLFARCLGVALAIGAGVLVAQTWIVDVFEFVDVTGWRALTRSSVTAGVTLFLAYVGLELVRYVTMRYGVAHAGSGQLPAGEDEHATAASRLATLMPLLRIALFIVILVTALLIVLSEWGVNITPLIAGASVFGLALSFGSQTLVRDIVSGIFYLADDAFRVGEYIDCGKAKGTVEGFTLRSIRLRHQNGQVHTIPFGQLGQVTNFSRDWTTVKFNLRFARDTDVESLRKTVKKIGQEMLEDPELKSEFLEPLKLQGVADITENALICRFKFTVRPGKPSFIQREAVKRMVRTFPGLGIEFANALVAVQSYGNQHPGGVDQATAGAAVQSTLLRVQAEAAATSS